MDAFGINWLSLIRQLAICAIVLLFIVAFVVFIRVKRFPKFLVGIVGLLTAWTTIFPIAFFIFWTSIFISNIINPPQSFISLFSVYDSIASLGSGTIILTILLMIFYIAHIKNSPLVSDEERKYYQIGIVLLPIIVMPMYYLKFLKNETAANEKA
jgi:hypothetical protein